jgi:hypothetical protein
MLVTESVVKTIFNTAAAHDLLVLTGGRRFPGGMWALDLTFKDNFKLNMKLSRPIVFLSTWADFK